MAFKVFFHRVSTLNSAYVLKPQLAFSVSMSTSKLKVEHDRQNLIFNIRLDNTTGPSDCAVLRYRFTGNNEVDLISTNVPDAFRGRGVAVLLTKAALEFLVEENLKAHVSCWYINKYIEENPQLGYRDLIISHRKP